LDFRDLVTWGFSVVVLANGAWRDRPLPVDGIDQYIDRGLIYQNPFIYWFNHKEESDYSGQHYDVPPGTIVVGGGLASLDVVKAVQVELYERALKAKGIETTMLELEHKGIPSVCAAHGVNPDDLGIEDVVLYYRRRDVDMPLADPPNNATPEQIEKTQQVRRKILSKVMEKYRVRFKERHVSVAALAENGRLVGLRFAQTQIEGRNAIPIPGSETDVRTPLVISSVGSIPEPIPGVEMKGEVYSFKDWDTGEYTAMEGVFGLGNVVTGRGNIDESRKHAAAVSRKILQNYLGVGNGDRDLSSLYAAVEARARLQMESVKDFLEGKPPLPVPQVNSILARVHQRWEQIRYTSYRKYIELVKPQPALPEPSQKAAG
jgi:NADPH-dependent glutamate synthase beta subunit-like oxidoreductase